MHLSKIWKKTKNEDIYKDAKLFANSELNEMKEVLEEIGEQEEEKYLSKFEFCGIFEEDYTNMVNTKPKKDEIGLIIKNGKKHRLIYHEKRVSFNERKEEYAKLFTKIDNCFLPNHDCNFKNKYLIGVMYGCIIMMPEYAMNIRRKHETTKRAKQSLEKRD